MTIAIRLTVILIFLVCACNSDTAKNNSEGNSVEVKTTLSSGPISIAEANTLHKRGRAIFVDLRTPEEIANYGKIEGAIEMNIKDADFKKRFQNLDGSYPIVFYCQGGDRSEAVYKMSQQLGFSRVYDMTEGYGGWQNYKGD